MEINNQNFTFKYGLRPMFMWEEMTGKPFAVETLFDTYIFCYCCLVSNPDNPSITFDEFINWCDEHPELIAEFNKFMDSEVKKRNVTEDKKKVTKRKPGRPKKN